MNPSTLIGIVASILLLGVVLFFSAVLPPMRSRREAVELPPGSADFRHVPFPVQQLSVRPSVRPSGPRNVGHQSATSGPPVRHLGATGPPRGGQKSRGGKGAGAAIGGLGNSWAREMGGPEPPGPEH